LRGTARELSDEIAQLSWAKSLVVEGRLSRDFVHLPGAIADHTQLYEAAHRSITNMAQCGSPPRARMWLGLANREDVAQRLFSPETSGSFLQRVDQLSLNDVSEWCFAVNGLTGFDEALSDFVAAEVISGLVRSCGSPLVGFDVYAFAGKYGQTPLGIHSDVEDSILIHLGPGEKCLWTWDRETYRNHYGDDQLHRNAYLSGDRTSTAQAHLMRGGDIFFIPAGMPHLAASQSYSITIGVIPNIASGASLVTSLVADLTGRLASPDDCKSAFLDPMRTFDDEISVLRSLGSEQGLRSALTYHLGRLESNGWLHPSPQPMEGISETSAGPFVVPRHYPLVLTPGTEHDVLHVRGQTLRLPTSEAMQCTLAWANAGAPWTVDELHLRCNSEWNFDAVEALVVRLIGINGVRLAKP
jgi:Cupin superfamily protein